MKVIVAHPGRQHSFRVAKALKLSGALYKYVTTVYTKDDSLLMKIVRIFLSKDNYRRAQGRKCNGLNDEDVVQFCEFQGLLLLALQRIDFTRYFSNKYQNYVSRLFQKKLAYYAIRNNVDAIISYDTNSSVLFSILKSEAPWIKCIMDNAHPNRHYLYSNYHENWNCVGNFSRTLEACGYLTNIKCAEEFGKEVLMADYHIVASSYSVKALMFEGIPFNKIYRVPYGVDKNKFVKSTRVYDGQKLNVLFVGEVNQRKGIRQVLEAAKFINSSDINFDIIGTGKEYCADLYSPYEHFVHFLGRVPFDVLLEKLSSSHIFIFPTMGEGFGLVLLEAMAAGLPVITTKNCGGADIVLENENGFLIDVGNTDALVEKILWFKNHPKDNERMSMNAISTAQIYTWEKYEMGIFNSIVDILSK